MNCRHYAPDMANACREPVSEPVQDKDRANFCDWFSPAAAPNLSTTDKSNTAKKAFAALFGNE